jgi:hypothetical protein
MASVFRDFIPAEENLDTGKGVFTDFVPAPETAVLPPKPKAKVVLSEEDKQALAEMEAETAELTGGLVVTPVQGETDAPNESVDQTGETHSDIKDAEVSKPKKTTKRRSARKSSKK